MSEESQKSAQSVQPVTETAVNKTPSPNNKNTAGLPRHKRRRLWRSLITSFLITVLFLNFAHDPYEFFRYIRYNIPHSINDFWVSLNITWPNVWATITGLFWIIVIVTGYGLIFFVPIHLFLRWEHKQAMKNLHLQWPSADDDQSDSDHDGTKRTNEKQH